MKNAWRARAAFAIVFAFVAVGCDSTQPDRIETRTAALSFKTRANVNLWTCYDTPSTACFTAPDSTGNPRREDRAVPWRYSVKITIIRAGSVDEVLATSLTGVVGSSVQPGDVVDDFVNLGNYDLDAPAAPDRTINGIHYSNGKLVSTGSPIYLATISVDPGITNLLEALPATPTAAPTFEFNLNTGDTVVVRARKQALADGPQVVPALVGVQLSGTLALSGVTVPVLGTDTSSLDDKAGFTFSFTVQ